MAEKVGDGAGTARGLDGGTRGEWMVGQWPGQPVDRVHSLALQPSEFSAPIFSTQTYIKHTRNAHYMIPVFRTIIMEGGVEAKSKI